MKSIWHTKITTRVNLKWIFVIPICILGLSCGDDEVITTSPEDDLYHQEFPIVYSAELPEGKMPYPHHLPEYNQAQYDSLVQSIFVINNYGLYQCGDTEGSCYFHDGLDFVLDNGTPIFAIEAGTIRSNIGGNEYYRTLVVEDADEPGMAWSYTHIHDFQNKLGTEVSKGQYLGRVNFQGLEHIHLSRTKLREGGSWEEFEDLINVYPDTFFTFIDDASPIIKTPFHYFRNESDSIFISEEGICTIHGEVDIVVSMRDQGQYAGGFIENSGYWGDRLAVRNISYRIIHEGEELLSRNSFDFRDLEFVFHRDKWLETLTLFKFAHVLDPDAGSHNMFHSHYIITNAAENHQGSIKLEDGNLSWNTLEKDDLDQPKYPNGLYTIEIAAYDSNGNSSTKSENVIVEN